jgi:hypothetical protein
MVLPNFLVIGPHKTGTTSLHQYLRQHAEVFLPTLKEPRYFSYESGGTAVPSSPFAWGEKLHPVKTWEDYLRLFAPRTTQTAIGEVSPCYFNHPTAPWRVDEALPGVRLIASLRDPVDRAYSDYLMAVRNGRETRPFVAIMEEHGAWHDTLAYLAPCRRWLARFPRERLRFIRAEALAAETEAALRDIFAFLQVDPNAEVDTSVRFNKTGRPWSKRLDRILNGCYTQKLRPHVPESLLTLLRPLKRANLRTVPALRAADRARVLALLREHILRLQDLLDEDLSAWLQVERAPRLPGKTDCATAKALATPHVPAADSR